MKKVFLLAMSALAVLGCNTKSASSNGDETKEGREVETQESREVETQIFEYENNNDHFTVKLSVEFPVGGDQELGDCIFEFIKEALTYDHDCSDDLDVYRNDCQGLLDLFGPWKSDDMREAWNAYTEGTGQEITLSYSDNIRIVENNENYMTCLCENESFTGADGFWANYGATYLKSDCSEVTNEYLFKDPSSRELATLLRDDLIEKYCRGREANWDDPDLETIEDVLYLPFYVTREGLSYFYRRGLILPQNVEGTLPWDKVKDLLTDEAKKLHKW